MKNKVLSSMLSIFMIILLLITGNNSPVKAQEIRKTEYTDFNANSVSNNSLPLSIDNSDTKYFPEITTQIGNSCQSYVLGYYIMTYEYNRLHNTSANSPENIMSPSWLFNIVNNGKNQGAAFTSTISVLKKQGIVSTADVPIESLDNYPDDDYDPYYTNLHAKDNIWLKALDNRIKDSFNIKLNTTTDTPIKSEKDENLTELKKALAAGHILAFCNSSNSYVYSTVNSSNHKGETIVISNQQKSKISHAMTLVGYDDTIWVDINNNGKVDVGEKGAFKVANSSGKGFGNEGFIWIAYDAINKVSSVSSATNLPKRISAFASEGFYGITLDNSSNNDQVYLEFTLNTSKRNKVNLQITDTDENPEFATKLYLGICAGSLSYDGTTTASDGKFVIDLSKYNSKFTREKILNDGIKFTITDEEQDYTNLTVKEVYLIDKATNTRIQLNDKYTSVDGDSVELYSKKVNFATIYYKTRFDNPYIHYKVENKQWTNAPGIPLKHSYDLYGYSYKAKINLGKENKLTACFNDGNGEWDNNNKQNYTFNAGYYTLSNGKITEISNPVRDLTVTNLNITNLSANDSNSIIEGNTILFKATVENANSSTKYKYVLTRPDGTQSVLRDYSSYSELSWLTSKPGKYTVTAYASDGWATAFKSVNFEVKKFQDISISNLTSSLGNEFTVGKTTTLNINAQDGYSSTYYYSIKVNDTEILNSTTNSSVNFTPNSVGIYNIIATVTDARGNKATKTMTLKVNEVQKNQTTIYYKGYENPNIHYKIGNGQWTNAPGIKMESNSDVDGYNYAITIDLKNETSLTACFNNGSSWDSNNGKNYTFNAGYYTYSNGVITKIDKPNNELKINSITCSSGTTMKYGSKVNLKINATGGQGPYTYYLYYYGYGSGRLNYLIKDGSYNTASFTPDYPQKTTIYAEVIDSAGNKVEYNQSFDVKYSTKNEVTIYYNGYANPYIHYQIGNKQWTNAPGVKMEASLEKPGYGYKITIDLDDDDKLTACFNNGNGNWDSNNGKNYTFTVGKYTYSNGNITKID